MAYATLVDLQINKDYVSREIDLITFKSIISKIEVFSNALKNNFELLKTEVEDNAKKVGTKLTISNEQPDDHVLGDHWIKILN